MKKNNQSKLSKLHITALLLVDTTVLFTDVLITFFISAAFADFSSVGLLSTVITAVILIALCIFGMAFFKTYQIVLRFARAGELLRIVCGITFGVAAATLFCYAFEHDFPVTFFVLFYLLSVFTVCTERIVCSYMVNRLQMTRNKQRNKPTLIIGAGFTGMHVLQELLLSETDDSLPIGFVDDDPHMQDRRIEGVPIIGPTVLIPEICKKYDVKTVIFAIPSCNEDKKKKILSLCTTTDCEIRVVPSLLNLKENVRFLPQARTINVTDVLGRDTVNMDSSDFIKYAKGKTVMVTGVGSIGSEICRQVVKCGIKRLVMVDIYENNAYDIQQELIRSGYGDMIATEIASVRDNAKMRLIFEKYKPDILFHAAAHKHVPLMEHNPEEAVKNNIRGTYNVAHLARKYKIEKMVLISTDKAVNPTNVMGATKRFCEMIMQYMAQNYGTDTSFVTVRFGNVLGSNGSVIPLFVKQIENGGPVTVTHPDIIRYFMTIPEAVSLVLEAGAMANNGEIFVLDMGEPFKITTLAENLIKLYGYKPYEEMPIEFIGLRPGEKLFEELLMDEEGLKSTKNKSIFIGNQISIDPEIFRQELDTLTDAAKTNNTNDVVAALKKAVPTFKHE